MRFPRLFLAAFIAVAAARAAETHDYIHSKLGTSKEWTALKWSAEDAALFGGMPDYNGPDHHIVLVRYSFFASGYNVDKLSPLWVAHVDEQDSMAKDDKRKGGNWDRSTDKFKPDDNVVTYSNTVGLRFVTDANYVNANPPELPIGEKNHGKITRGHMASNQEMKSLGTDAEGEVSQTESFSFANVCPQMQHHNSPLWETLEVDCIKWAGKLGRVAVISGPVYAPDPKLAAPANRIVYTVEKNKVRIPIPTHFFKVIIGRMDGKVAAVGFLIPHEPNLDPKQLGEFVVPVRRIEEVTGLNFMPALGKNDAIEKKADGRWLPMVP